MKNLNVKTALPKIQMDHAVESDVLDRLKAESAVLEVDAGKWGFGIRVVIEGGEIKSAEMMEGSHFKSLANLVRALFDKYQTPPHELPDCTLYGILTTKRHGMLGLWDLIDTRLPNNHMVSTLTQREMLLKALMMLPPHVLLHYMDIRYIHATTDGSSPMTVSEGTANARELGLPVFDVKQRFHDLSKVGDNLTTSMKRRFIYDQLVHECGAMQMVAITPTPENRGEPKDSYLLSDAEVSFLETIASHGRLVISGDRGTTAGRGGVEAILTAMATLHPSVEIRGIVEPVVKCSTENVVHLQNIVIGNRALYSEWATPVAFINDGTWVNLTAAGARYNYPVISISEGEEGYIHIEYNGNQCSITSKKIEYFKRNNLEARKRVITTHA